MANTLAYWAHLQVLKKLKSCEYDPLVYIGPTKLECLSLRRKKLPVAVAGPRFFPAARWLSSSTGWGWRRQSGMAGSPGPGGTG